MQILGQQSDLVEEQRAPVSRLEQPRFGFTGVGEGAPLVAEQLGLQERLGDRRAVDRDERATLSRPCVVESPCEQSLAGPGLAEDQDGRKATCLRLALQKMLDLLSNGNEPRTVTDQLGKWRHGARILRRFNHLWWIFTTSFHASPWNG